jgi:hypothetical protein
MIEIAQMLFVYTPLELRIIIIFGIGFVIYLHLKGVKKDRDFNKAIQKCKNGKEIEREVMKFYDK